MTKGILKREEHLPYGKLNNTMSCRFTFRLVRTRCNRAPIEVSLDCFRCPQVLLRASWSSGKRSSYQYGYVCRQRSPNTDAHGIRPACQRTANIFIPVAKNHRLADRVHRSKTITLPFLEWISGSAPPLSLLGPI